LPAARILEGNDLQSGSGQQGGELLDVLVRRSRRLEGADPDIAIKFKSRVAGRDQVRSHRRGTADHIFHVLGDDLLVAQAVLH